MKNFEIIILFIIAQLIQTFHCKCDNKFDISITQKIEKEGFHREIRWLIEIASNAHQIIKQNDCKLALMLNVSNGLYVNPDEISELNRIENMTALINGIVDVELPMHLSTSHQFYIYLPKSDKNKHLIKFPIHLRYQRAQIIGGFGKVILEKPSLLMNCSKEIPKFCPSQIEGICDYNNWDKNCIWTSISYQSLFDEVELLVPVGDLDDYPLVSVITLLLGCAGCIYILSVLSTTPL